MARPTSSALFDLFRGAQRDVLIADDVFDLFTELYVAMRNRRVTADLFVHVTPTSPRR